MPEPVRGGPPWRSRLTAAAIGVALVAPGAGARLGSHAAVTASPLTGPASPIQHVIEIMLENHTFDNLFAHFPGAAGVPPGTTLPTVAATAVVPRFAGANQGDVLGVLDNSRGGELAAMDRGPGGYRMDGYTRHPTDGLAAITLIPPGDDPVLQSLAAQYTLLDRNFQPAVAPTQPNVLYALAGTAQGWMVNTTPPAPLRWWSIFDQLTQHHRSWRIYYGVPSAVLQGSVWYRIIPPGTAGDITTTSRFLQDLSRGRLPDFAFIRPGVGYSEEPPEDVEEGDLWLGQLVRAVAQSRYWRSTAIFITYDEGGGFWDHVAPPIVTPFGYGTRTPMVVVSPFVRPGVVGTTTTNLSVLAFMAHLWGLPPLDALAARQSDLAQVFDMSQHPLPPPRLPPIPLDTIDILGANTLADPGPVAPGQPLRLHLHLNTAGLVQDPRGTGRVRLRLLPPAGVAVPPGFPRVVDLTRGGGAVTVRLAIAGYYRLLATGPLGSRGWLTLDIGVSPRTAPDGPAG